MDEKKILTEVKTWITEYLEVPNENFGGMPVCPFVKAEREKNKLMFEIWHPNKTSFTDILEKFEQSDFESALIICMNTDGLLWEEVDRKKYQKAIQLLIEETRKGSPYFLINIAGVEELNKAHRTLWKTPYFDKFSEKEVKTLKVYPKNKSKIL
jgi:hypothetical protein